MPSGSTDTCKRREGALHEGMLQAKGLHLQLPSTHEVEEDLGGRLDSGLTPLSVYCLQ